MNSASELKVMDLKGLVVCDMNLRIRIRGQIDTQVSCIYW